MRTRVLITAAVGAVVTVLVASAGIAPAQESRPPEREQGGDNPGGPGGPGGEQRRGGGGRFGGPGGPGGMGGGDRPIVKQFDKDADGRLNTDERAAARDFVKKNPGGRGGFGGGGPGGRGGFGPGGMVAQQVLSQGDADKNEKLSRAEMVAVAGAWFDELDTDKAQKLSEDQFADRIGSLLPMQGGAAGGGSGGPVFQPGGGGGGPGGGGPGGGGFGGRGGFSPGRMLGPVLFEAADADKDKSLTRDELATRFGTWFDAWDADKDAALTDIELRDGFNAALPRPNFGGRGGGPGGGGPGGGRGNQEPAKPGPRVAQADVKPVNASVPLYDSATLRTLFFDFDAADWEAELGDFRDTDVEVPAKLTVDGTELPNVGIRFRGMSSLGMVPEGRKRSLNVTVDLADKKQRLLGYKTLNLLNAHEDPTFLHTVLYFDVARNYIPAPKANFAKVVINGESWGVYTNAQQFNKEFIKEWFSNNDGARWKVRGSPGGRGGLEYLGEDPEPYKAIYGIKSPDVPQAWKDLARLCRVLNQTPPDQLEAALESILDVDGALWFLALENVFINGDGYWVRASDYCIYQETSGRFHIIPHDANETFGPGGGPGFGPGGPGGGGGFGGRQGGGRSGPGGGGGAGDVATRGPRDGGPTTRPMGGGGGGRGGLELDPLVGLDDSTKPLRSRLLAVPALRERYLAHVKTLAEQWLDWEKLGPVVARYRDLIGEEVAADTRKLESTEAFAAALSPGDAQPAAAAEPAQPFGRSQMSLRQFAQRRREYLLKYPAIAALKSQQPTAGDRPKAD